MTTLCPQCGERPRRRPGQRCTPCDVEREKVRRGGKRAKAQETPKFHRSLSGSRYIITSAQNNTPVEAAFFATLKIAAEHLGAELVVIPLRYRNPTSLAESDKAEDELWWAEETLPYLFNGRKKLGPNLVLVGDVKTQPTASTPLTGFESLTGAESCILGHPKMQFRAIPVPSGKFPKILTTTGACTRRNYSDTKAGKIGEFHHFLGAVIVELEGKRFHLRQINADRKDGSFTDLENHFTTAGVQPAPPALALIMGDTHVRVMDPEVDRATFGPGGIVETLEPKTLVFHDLVDGETTNPHELGNFFLSAAKRKAGRSDVKAEVQEVVNFVNARGKGRDVVIVDSNHHDFLARWAIRTDARDAGINTEFLLETQLFMLRSARMGPGGAQYEDPFTHWLRELGAAPNVRCLKTDESFKVADIECGMHGHQGPNGARGSLKNLSRLGTKNVTGHSHTPGIQEGHYQVGTSTVRRLAYMRGPSGSLNTHCVVYASGKRALITVIHNKWRAAP